MLVLGIALMLALSSRCWGIIDGYEPDPNDTRFDAVAAIGLTQNMMCYLPEPPCFVNQGCSCAQANHGSGTLIAPNLVLMATHSGPDNYGCDIATPDPCTFTARFRRRPDGSLSNPNDCSTYFDVPIVQFLRPCALIDATVAVLEYPVTHIAPMAFDLTLRPQAGDGLILGGWGKDESGILPGKLFLKNVTCLGASCGVLTCTSGPLFGDSGGAMLVDTPSGLRIVGLITSMGGGTEIHSILGANPAALCGDFDGDGVVTKSDLELVEESIGQHNEGVDCAYDRNFDCTINWFELMIAHLTMGQACTAPCYADVSADHSVGSEDMMAVLLHWGGCGCADCPGDIDRSGSVGPNDLLYVINHWGACPG